MLLLVAVFGFSPINGARRWIKLKGFSIQPSEIAKLSLALFLARFLERRAGDEASFWRTFLPCFLVLGVVAGLVAKEPDLGTALMLAIICFTICFAAGMRPRHLVYAVVPALLYVGKMLIFTPFRMKRLSAFIDPWADAQGTGYQVVQSLIAVGFGRHARTWLCARPSEAFVSAVRAFRFYFRRRGRRVGIWSGR